MERNGKSWLIQMSSKQCYVFPKSQYYLVIKPNQNKVGVENIVKIQKLC
jgi:hypothetical protein